MKKDKTQGVVFVLPKSKEFFGRIDDDVDFGMDMTPEAGSETSHEHVQHHEEGHDHDHTQPEVEAELTPLDMTSLRALKDNLGKLSQLHTKLKEMLDELDVLLKDS